MTSIKNTTILFDLAHNEMLNIQDHDFSELLNLIKSLNLKIKKNDNKSLTKKLLCDIDILVIGNPIDNYFSNIEIENIIDFVREGGRLLLISEYGADYLQKTNLNDISVKNFGIFFQKNIVKESNKINQNCSSILSIQDFQKHKITNQLRNIILGGCCSLILNKNAEPILKINDIAIWSEVYNNSPKQWSKEEEQMQIIAACAEYGRGKVFALGDVDIFTNDPHIGINQLDNRKFILNVLNWFTEPIKESDLMMWILNQMGAIQNDIKDINYKINNIIETLTILENRISVIEDSDSLKQVLKISKLKK